MRNWNPIDELNREQQRRFIFPILFAAVLPVVIVATLVLGYAHGPEIDRFANDHPFLIAGITVTLCLFGLWRMFKMMYW